jgi:hypothetical protein
VEREEERRRLELGFLRAADTAIGERLKARQRTRESGGDVVKRDGEGFYGVLVVLVVLEAQSRVAE